jgi:type III secretory pathway component EscU
MASFNFGLLFTRLISYVLAISAASLIIFVCQELMIGPIFSTSKLSPKKLHTVTAQPLKQWLSLASLTLLAFVLGLMSAGAFWLARMEADDKAP